MEQIDPGKNRLLEKGAEYLVRLESVAKAYFEEHQANGCTCDI